MVRNMKTSSMMKKKLKELSRLICDGCPEKTSCDAKVSEHLLCQKMKLINEILHLLVD